MYDRSEWQVGDIAFVVHENPRRLSGRDVRMLMERAVSDALNRRGAFVSTDLMWVGKEGYLPADDPRIVSAERLIPVSVKQAERRAS